MKTKPPVRPLKQRGRREPRISLDAQLAAREYAANRKAAQDGKQTFAEMLVRARPAPGVVPEKAKLAMDEAVTSWASGPAFNLAFTQGYTFLGYPLLSELAQVAEYRVISDVISEEATRKWIEIKSSSDDKGKAEEIQQLDEELKRLKAESVYLTASWQDSTFGRAHVYIDTGEQDDPDELKQDLGDGGKVSRQKLKRGSLKALRNIEPIWAYPNQYNASDPFAPDWYKPDQWYVMTRQLHVSRFHTFIGKPVPDLFKPAFSFGGLSMIQMAKPYVDNWLQTRQSVNDLLVAFSTMVLKTDLSSLLTTGGGSGQDVYARMDIFNQFRSNRGSFVLDKATEEFANVSAPLGSLDKLQAQAQEHMAAVSRIPLVKLLGIAPTGLNASSEGELRAFYDTISGYQKRFIKPSLDVVFKLAQINLWGKVDPDLKYEFLPLFELDEKGLAEVEKTKADTDKTLVDAGILDPSEARTRIANSSTNDYGDIDPDEVPEPVGPEPGEIHETEKDDEASAPGEK